MKNYPDLVTAVINDCLIVSRYYDEVSGDSCAIGGIAESAGLDLGEWYEKYQYNANHCGVGASFNERSNSSTEEFTLQGMKKLVAPIIEKYGLTKNQLTTIQSLNDFRDHDLRLRRRDILNQLSEWRREELEAAVA